MSQMQDLDPATRLSEIALALFDGAAARILPAGGRRALEQAARCYGAARRSGDDRPDRVGRDLVLAQAQAALHPSDLAIAACAVALQREKLRPGREPAFLALEKHDRPLALGLAAVLRVAAAIADAPVSQGLVRADAGGATLVVGGTGAAEWVAAAEASAGPWREAIGALDLRETAPGEFTAAATNGAANGVDLPETRAADPPPVGLGLPVGGEPVAEAARRQLRRFFDKLLAREDAVAKGEDAEDVHQMRVATRRLRASLQVVEGVFDHDLIRRYRRGLQRIARPLGAVRDCDVFLEHVLAYRESLPEDRRAAVGPLIDAVSAERAQARQALLEDLSSKRYRKLKREFARFLTRPGAGVLRPAEPGITERVRDFAGSAIWRRYELWRAYEVALPSAGDETLHQARIAGKRLRYTLEFFADALGRNVDQALDPLIALQECLGAMQDVVTARGHVAMLGLAEDPGAQAYLAARAAERETHLAQLHERWEQVDNPTYRRQLLELLVRL